MNSGDLPGNPHHFFPGAVFFVDPKKVQVFLYFYKENHNFHDFRPSWRTLTPSKFYQIFFRLQRKVLNIEDTLQRLFKGKISGRFKK